MTAMVEAMGQTEAVDLPALRFVGPVAGFPERALVMTGPDGVVVWSHQADTPADLPGANLIFDALDAAAV